MKTFLYVQELLHRSSIFAQGLVEKLILIVILDQSAAIAPEIALDTNDIHSMFSIQLFDTVTQGEKTTGATNPSTRIR